MLTTGELRVRVTRGTHALLPGRTHQRADQFYRGVRVWGGDVSRQLAGGQTVSVFGVLYDGIAIDTSPALTPAEAKSAIEAIAGARLGATRMPELVVLPIANGQRYALAYTERVISARGLYIYFIDARSGTLLMELNDLKTQTSAVGRGRGVLGDEKKVSTRTDAGAFQTWDELRPPDVRTYDMKGNLQLTEDFLNGFASLPFSEIARDSDNEWSDGAVVDAHVYPGWTYDYFFNAPQSPGPRQSQYPDRHARAPRPTPGHIHRSRPKSSGFIISTRSTRGTAFFSTVRDCRRASRSSTARSSTFLPAVSTSSRTS